MTCCRESEELASKGIRNVLDGVHCDPDPNRIMFARRHYGRRCCCVGLIGLGMPQFLPLAFVVFHLVEVRSSLSLHHHCLFSSPCPFGPLLSPFIALPKCWYC